MGIDKRRAFDTEDSKHVKHSRLGVWELYEEKHPELARIPGASRAESYLEIGQSLPFVWRMIKDIGSIENCWLLLSLYLFVIVLSSLIPAVALWYSGQLLKIVEIAISQRSVDKKVLFRVAGGRIGCAIAARIIRHFMYRLQSPLNNSIKQYYSVQVFRSMARLDLPTFEDPAVQRQTEAAWSTSGQSSVAWDTINMVAGLISTVVRLISQVSILISILYNQRDGPLMTILSFGISMYQWLSGSGTYISSGVWAATTRNKDWIRMAGMKRVIDDSSHRQEVVAGNMAEYLANQYRDAVRRLGDQAGDFHEIISRIRYKDRLSISALLQEALRELPMIVFTLRAVQYPASIPLSLASLQLIRENSSSFTSSILGLLDQTGYMAEQLASVRRLYEIENISNKVVDGREPYPENHQMLNDGISIEFRNVSFKYPGTEKYALKNISFKIKPGHLCIIVGANGSGKSTVLRLIARIHDPEEGDIFIDGRDIRSLKVADLRRAISVLFQDYTHFPLSISENIGLGDPENANDKDKIREAARLGGAEEFIDLLPDGFEAFLDRPVQDYYSDLPEGTKTLFGRSVEYSRIRGLAHMSATNSTTLSGGQMQRLALSRTFMRSVAAEPKVGLLLFDEPSASLDPTAEHDLFQRLRNLRGNKTMIFSSHRFGNLTRHADLILYMNDSAVAEEGTHEQLLKQQGEYARIWMLQAQAFL